MGHARHIGARLSGPPSKLLPPFFLPIWSRLAHEQRWHSIDFHDVSGLQVIEMKGAETRKHDSTPTQFEERIALTRNRGHEGGREGGGASRGSEQGGRRGPCTRTHPQPQTGSTACSRPKASKQAKGGRKEGGREGERAEDVDHYRRKLASDGRNDGRTEGGRTRGRGRWAQVRRNCRRRCLRGRAQNWRFPTKCSTK